MDRDPERLIRARAYEIWDREGRQEGGHEVHWHQAEEEILEEETAARQQEKDVAMLRAAITTNRQMTESYARLIAAWDAISATRDGAGKADARAALEE